MKAILQHTKNRERVPWTVSLSGPSAKWLPASKGYYTGTVVVATADVFIKDN